MRKLAFAAASLVTLLSSAPPAAAASISLLCGGSDYFDIGTKHNTLIEQNGDAPVIVYGHVKITDASFSGDYTHDGKKRAVFIDRKSGQLKLSGNAVAKPETRACAPAPAPGPSAPATKF